MANKQEKKQENEPNYFGGDYWQTWFLSLMEPQEYTERKDNNKEIKVYPRTVGLWKTVCRHIGTPTIGTHAIKCASQDDSCATVMVNIGIDVYEHLLGKWKHLPKTLRAQGIADAGLVNTKPPYGKHAAATAQTRAIGRALKWALCLDLHTTEEMGMEPEWDEPKNNNLASHTKLKSIKNMLDRLKVNNQFIQDETQFTVTEIMEGELLSVNHAQEILEKLNTFQNKGVPTKYCQMTKKA